MDDQIKIVNRILKITLVLVIIIFIILAFTLKKLAAQETKVIKDLEQWTSIGLSKKINKHWKLSLDQEFRFTKDMSNFDVYFSDLGVDYNINKQFSLGANYRFYQNKNNDGIFKTQHRWSSDITYKEKIDRFTFAYRLRFQNKDEVFYTDNSDNNFYNLRNRLSINYNIKDFKFDPVFELETFRQIDDLNNSTLNKLRWTLGLEYSVKGIGDIKFFGRFDNELNQTYNKDTYILGVGYKFKF
ncbi:MAG: hypothetical protein C0597_04310 [Marinilabiliales bacterium]|nr:MAG: hypothetical protein C0597_04310 [Marinilabiliales bacterium]